MSEPDELRVSCGFLHMCLRKESMELAFAGPWDSLHDVDDRFTYL